MCLLLRHDVLDVRDEDLRKFSSGVKHMRGDLWSGICLEALRINFVC